MNYSRVFIAFSCLMIVQAGHAQFKPLADFIPAGFSILDSASGDLNKDGAHDLVLVLKNDTEETNADTTRPLLLLQGNKTGQYKLIAQNDHVVMCKGCGGIFGDPFDGIAIKNGYFSIQHYGGSNWRWSRIITFRYDAVKKNFTLHRDAGASWHTSDPNKVEQKVHSKADFGKLSFAKYNNAKGW